MSKDEKNPKIISNNFSKYNHFLGALYEEKHNISHSMIMYYESQDNSVKRIAITSIFKNYK